jgi:uncharacterized membrane protein
MLIANISAMGWIHTIACLIALAAGGYVLAGRKGTRRHRRIGWWYVMSMLVLNLSILAVYNFDIVPGAGQGPGRFGIFHWMTLATLLATVLAVIGAVRQRHSRVWAHVHAQAMLFSYYMLVGGLINELAVRILPLRATVMQVSPHASNPAQTLPVQMAQSLGILVWLVLIVVFTIQVERRPRLPRRADDAALQPAE